MNHFVVILAIAGVFLLGAIFGFVVGVKLSTKAAADLIKDEFLDRHPARTPSP